MAAPFPSERMLIDGDAGAIEVVLHAADAVSPRAVAVVAHPHPLFGGTMDNKVVTTVARSLFDAGAAVYRFNFRGVGQSAGMHDEGKGETEDMLRVISHAQSSFPSLPLWLAGFSFGGAVALAASERVTSEEMILIAPAFQRLAGWHNAAQGGLPPESTIVIHGENDETVPLIDSFNWARPRNIPVVVIPGADHFFHLRLHLIKRIVSRLGAPR